MILLCLLAFMDNRRRCCPPVTTLHNYTGNFVLTPAVSMDANRSVSRLLPQLVWLSLLPTLHALQVAFTQHFTRKVATASHIALLTCSVAILLKVNKGKASFVGRSRTTARHALLS